MDLKTLPHEGILSYINTDLDILVGFSGGPDSSALLMALCALKQQHELKANVSALHINHGINENADKWEEHCKTICHSLGIDLLVEKVLIASNSKSFELEARNARLKVFERYTNQFPQICLAHHLNDQVETILFRLFRGTGIKGISGMSAKRAIGKGFLIRPFLQITKEHLIQYLDSIDIGYIKDASNINETMDRNFIRNSVVPLIESRWGAASKKIFEFGKLAYEETVILNSLFDHAYGYLYKSEELNKKELKELSSSLRRKVIRHWIEFNNLPMPNFSILQEIEKTFIESLSSYDARVSWGRSDDESHGVILLHNKQEIYFEII